jgi:hypothetical protein
MEWLSHVGSMMSALELVPFYISHALNSSSGLVFIDVILILAIHGLYILTLTRLFKRFVVETSVSEGMLVSLFSYMVMIFLVVLAHVMDIVLLSIALDSLKVFPEPLVTFYYVSGMYTTIGSSSVPGPQWQILSMLISFCGLFAFSISGSGLFSMLGFFLAYKEKKSSAKS